MPEPDPLACRDVASLRRVLAEGARAKYVFFWGHRRPAGGAVTATCLSQWYPAPFELGGHRYATAEHYMMVEKARLFGDAKSADRILAASSPGAAKKLGRGIDGFDEARWVAARFEIVARGNVAKFAQNTDLGAFLGSTANRVLVEASPQDRIWGIGLEASDARAADPEAWLGENLLGFALMEARERLAAQPDEETR